MIWPMFFLFLVLLLGGVALFFTGMPRSAASFAGLAILFLMGAVLLPIFGLGVYAPLFWVAFLLFVVALGVNLVRLPGGAAILSSIAMLALIGALVVPIVKAVHPGLPSPSKLPSAYSCVINGKTLFAVTKADCETAQKNDNAGTPNGNGSNNPIANNGANNSSNPPSGGKVYYDDTKSHNATTWTWAADVPSDSVLIAGAYSGTVNGQSYTGFLRAFTGGQSYDLDLTDGFVAVVPADQAKTWFTDRKQMYLTNGWTLTDCQGLPEWGTI